MIWVFQLYSNFCLSSLSNTQQTHIQKEKRRLFEKSLEFGPPFSLLFFRFLNTQAEANKREKITKICLLEKTLTTSSYQIFESRPRPRKREMRGIRWGNNLLQDAKQKIRTRDALVFHKSKLTITQSLSLSLSLTLPLSLSLSLSLPLSVQR